MSSRDRLGQTAAHVVSRFFVQLSHAHPPICGRHRSDSPGETDVVTWQELAEGPAPRVELVSWRGEVLRWSEGVLQVSPALDIPDWQPLRAERTALGVLIEGDGSSVHVADDGRVTGIDGDLSAVVSEDGRFVASYVSPVQDDGDELHHLDLSSGVLQTVSWPAVKYSPRIRRVTAREVVVCREEIPSGGLVDTAVWRVGEGILAPVGELTHPEPEVDVDRDREGLVVRRRGRAPSRLAGVRGAYLSPDGSIWSRSSGKAEHRDPDPSER